MISAKECQEEASRLDAFKNKIKEVRDSVGPLSGKSLMYCSDASIARHLRARNWNIKKATKMLRETLKWRNEYRPEEICWGDVEHEAQTGKIYRANYRDKQGRTVLVMRPGHQNSKSTKGQIRYLVYCMENAILNLPQDQEQMVWLIDFQGFNASNISVKVTRETARVLQDHYPERLSIAVLFNPPKFFEPFWTLVKPFLEQRTYRKVKFVYSDDVKTTGVLEELFSMDKLERSFGGRGAGEFDIQRYSHQMLKDDDRKAEIFISGDGGVRPVQLVNDSNSDSYSDADRSQLPQPDYMSNSNAH